MKLTPFRSMQKDACDACAFLCKAAALTTAVVAAGIALHRFLQDVEPNCSDILKGFETKRFVDLDFDCFEKQQRAIGAGSPEECMTALTDYHPIGASTLDVVDAMGGAENFCNLRSVELQEDVVGGDPIPKELVETILEQGAVRGIGSSPFRPFVGVKTSVTTTMTHPDFAEEYIEKAGMNDHNVPHAEIFFHAYADTKRAWETASCYAGQWKCFSERLTDAHIEELSYLVRGATTCKSDRNAGFDQETCRKMV